MKRLLILPLALIPFLCSACADEKPKEPEVPAGPNPVVLIKTSMGDIKAELFQRDAPITVKNFLHYVDEKHYDDTVFHRVMRGFMIQGGGFKKGLAAVPSEEAFGKMEKPSGKGIKNEARSSRLSNEKGTLAMARTGDPNSATAQFYINVVDNEDLDPGPKASDPRQAGYAVFGKVIAGMDVVDKIRSVRTKTLFRSENVPVEDVVIESIRRVDN